MMEVSSIESLVRPFVKDCPSIIIEQQLATAAREFCKRSLWWTVEKNNVSIDIPTFRAVVPKTSGLDNIRVVKATLTGESEPLHPQDDLRYLPTHSASKPEAYSAKTTEHVYFGPRPNAAVTVTLEIAVMPSVGATEVHSDLVTLWAEALRDGAIALIQAEPGYPWSNAAGSLWRTGEFNKRISDARIMKELGLSNSEPMIETIGFV